MQPVARQPTADTAPRPRPQTATERRVAQPGDRICDSCAEPNDPERRFCRRCGNNLQEAAVVPIEIPWWRRIFRRIFSRTQRRYEAGERTKGMRQGKPSGRPSGVRITYLLRWALGILFAFGVVGYVAIPSIQGLVNRGVRAVVEGGGRILTPSLEPIRPTGAEASHEVTGHPVSDVVDTFTNTEWQAGGATPSLTLGFKEPFELGALIVHNGASKDTFLALRRAKVIEIVFSDGSVQQVDLKDVHDPQKFDVSGPSGDALTIRVVETYGPDGAPVAISELEFFAKG
jgi:hypothetical protein